MGGKKAKELTPAEKKRLQQFNSLREELIKNGYQEKVMSISVLKANLMVFATSVPIVVVLFSLYFLVHSNFIGVAMPLNERLLFLLAFFISIVVHELIHGVTWSLYCKKGWKSIAFGFVWEYLTPYCTCGEGLPFKGYFLGTLMPTVVLGFLPCSVALIIGSPVLMMFGLFMILCGGGDLYLLWLIRKMKHAVLMDHPYSVGCVAFTKTDD